MIKLLGNIWGFLNNKKSPIAAVSGVALAWAQSKGLVGQMDSVYLSALLTIFTGVAVGHKVYKSGQDGAL